MDDAVTEANASRPASPVPPLPDSRPTYRFTWDPALRRAGPGSVSEATDPRPDDYAGPGGNKLLFLPNNSSLRLALPHDWSSSRHGFHAISTVLNNPHKRAAPPKAHAPLPPPAAPAELARVRRKDFEPYLSSVAPEWEPFERSTRQARESGGGALVPDTAAMPDTPRTPLFLPPPTPAARKPLPSLGIIPEVFFSPTFDLGDPETFAQVVEDGPDGSGDADPASLAHALPLLEKLSHYADVVEQHLVREVAARSASFFAALANMQDLQAESAACLVRIARLRAMLRAVDQRTARGGLALVRLEARRANVERVAEGVRAVRDVGELVRVGRGLVDAGQWGEALGVIEQLELLWEPQPPPPPLPDKMQFSPGGGRDADGDSDALAVAAVIPDITASSSSSSLLPQPQPQPVPLSALHAFATLPADLRELTLKIATSLTADVVSVLKADLQERAEAPRRRRSRQRTGGGDDEKADELLRDRLRPLLQGLERTKGMKSALESWREVVMGQVREAIKRHIPLLSDYTDDDDGKTKLVEKSASLAKELREMPHEDFLKLARRIYASLLRCIEGAQTQMAVISSLLESTLSKPDATELTAALGETLTAACEQANTRASKVLLARTEQHARLTLGEFHAVFAATWAFVVACEVRCRRMIVVLRGAAVTQAKAFLGAFHAARLTTSARLVEEEQWAAVDVAADVQHAAALLVDAAMRDPEEFALPPAEALEEEEGGDEEAETVPAGQQPLSPPSTPPGDAQPPPLALPGPAKQLRIEERPYFAVGATLQVLVVLLADYVKLIVNLPLLTTDAMGRVIEFLKAFNSRTCQVVLGAGAMRSAGLKNITAKHLALASQSLSIAVALVPYVRETFRRHLSAHQAVMLVEFDRLRRDLQEHQEEIHAKLVAIMADRLGVHCRALQEVKWSESAERPGPNGYMEVLVKETVTLHKVLSKYLSAQTVEMVMGQVLAAITHRVSEEFEKIELASLAAKDRMLVDARYAEERLRAVGGFKAVLSTVVEEKAVPRGTAAAGPPAAAPAATTAGSTGSSRLKEKMAAAVVRSGGGGAAAGSGGGGGGGGAGDGAGDQKGQGTAPALAKSADGRS